MDKLEQNRVRARRRYWRIKKSPTLLRLYRIATTLSVRRWRAKNPLKTMAQRKVFVAIRNGTLKKNACFCGNKKSQAHHEDYSKPLEVVWLCKKHHVEADTALRNRLSTGGTCTRYT